MGSDATLLRTPRLLPSSWLEWRRYVRLMNRLESAHGMYVQGGLYFAAAQRPTSDLHANSCSLSSCRLPPPDLQCSRPKVTWAARWLQYRNGGSRVQAPAPDRRILQVSAPRLLGYGLALSRAL